MIDGWMMLTMLLQEYIRTSTASSWHMSGTAKMGRSAEDACVDSRFRVFGLNALRVVDMSVAPFVPRHVKVNAGEK
jgi:choline dehydrogenase-like flavoprotein